MLPPEVAMVRSQAMLLLRVTFGRVAVQYQESVSMSVAHATTKATQMSLVWAVS